MTLSSLHCIQYYWHKHDHSIALPEALHQEKHFCAPKSHQKLEYLIMSLCSVWAGLRFCHTCEKLSVVSELTFIPLSTLSLYIRKKDFECQMTLQNHNTLCGISIVFWLVWAIDMPVKQSILHLCTVHLLSPLALCTEFDIRKSMHKGPNTVWNMANVGVMTRRNRVSWQGDNQVKLVVYRMI